MHYSLEFPGQTAEDGLVILLLVYTVVVVITAVVSGVVSDRGGWRRAPVVLSCSRLGCSARQLIPAG